MQPRPLQPFFIYIFECISLIRIQSCWSTALKDIFKPDTYFIRLFFAGLLSYKNVNKLTSCHVVVGNKYKHTINFFQSRCTKFWAFVKLAGDTHSRCCIVGLNPRWHSREHVYSYYWACSFFYFFVKESNLAVTLAGWENM